MRYSTSKNGVTLKTGLGIVQGHWKWRHSIDRIRVPISVSWRYLVSFFELLVENREIFIPHMYLALPKGVIASEFLEGV